jgi:L,D-transpeptidase YcbB
MLATLVAAGSWPSLADNPAATSQALVAQSNPSQGDEPLAEALRQLLTVDAGSLSGLGLADSASLKSFYAGRSNEPIWIEPSGLSALGNVLRRRLAQISASGLPEIATLLKADGDREQRLDPISLAERELILSSAFIMAAIDPRAPDGPMPGLRALRDAASAADPRILLERDVPVDPAFWRLRAAIADYRAMAVRGGWPQVPEGPKLTLGDSGVRIEALRERLAASGDLDPAVAAATAFDDVLDAAVRRFQRRHGLAEDGVVGKATLAALNLPIAARIQSLSINLARLLDPPREWGQRYIAVNAAAASYRLIDDGATIFERRAIVGRRSWPTPRMDGIMTALEFNPYWNVPPRIARLELWPKIHSDPGYLARNDMRLVNGQIRQEPGPKNPLGVVKFIFPNPYDVYLHDTNNHSLFDRTDRFLSHGCIRIPNARDLAAYLLRADPSWTSDRVTEAIESKRNLKVELPRPIAVHLVYDTAWVEADGTVQFRNDVYGWDAAANRVMASTYSSCPTLR